MARGSQLSPRTVNEFAFVSIITAMENLPHLDLLFTTWGLFCLDEVRIYQGRGYAMPSDRVWFIANRGADCCWMVVGWFVNHLGY